MAHMTTGKAMFAKGNLPKVPKVIRKGNIDRPNLNFKTIDRLRDKLESDFSSVRKIDSKTLVIDGIGQKTIIKVNEVKT